MAVQRMDYARPLIDQTKEFDHGGDTEESVIQVPAEDEILPLENKIYIQSIYKRLKKIQMTPKEHKVFALWLKGMKHVDIAKMMGVTRPLITRYITRAKIKCKLEIDYQ